MSPPPSAGESSRAGWLQGLAEDDALHLETVQTVAAVTGGVALLLGLLASVDVLLFPRGGPWVAWVLHPLFFILGAAGGMAAVIRGRHADRQRWEVLEDPRLTDGERELAHRVAERERRWAGTVFFMAPLFLSYWMAYQFGGEEGSPQRGEHGSLPIEMQMLMLSPMVGFLAGLFLAHWALGPKEKPY
jgi:hypothetical protein